MAESNADIKARARTALKSLRTRLGSAGNASCQINLVKSLRAPNLKNTRHLGMTRQLGTRLRKAVVESLLTAIEDALSDADGVVPFNFQAYADGRLAAFPIAKFGWVSHWIGMMPSNDKIPQLGPGDNHIGQLRFTNTVLTFPSDGDVVSIVRKSGNVQLPQRKIILSLIDGTTYDYYNSESSLMIDTDVDFFILDDLIFVLNYRRFESILEFRDLTAVVANKVLDAIFSALPVTNSEQLKAVLLSSARNLNKLANQHDKKHLPKLDMSKIQKLIEQEHLPLAMVKIKGSLMT